uniref:Pleckstrin homology domain containing, family G (with RhoGef domain) member 6 n=1 Tax=Neogobius melanostomus TaxID=47308 RepID=A0A8C6WVE4_9GOBI
MDPARNSLSKVPHLNGVGNGSPLDAAVDPWGAEEDRQRDGEVRDTDNADVPPSPVQTTLHHRGSAESHKKFYSYQRRTKQKVVTDFSTISKGTSAAAKPRAALRQVLFNQSDKNPAPEAHGQLDLLKHNLEAFTVPVSLKWKWAEENQSTSLESNWTDIVPSHSTMSKMQRNQQDALWEFIYTELIYINKLLVIRDLVLGSLLNLHQHGLLLEVTPQLLFSNLPSIISAHQLFWQDVLYPMLQEVRRTGAPFDPVRLEAGCLQFRRRFSSYKHYCWEEESTQEFARRQAESSPLFHAYVQWVETHPLSERMRLGDMQAKPHQRITKYPLLLGAVLKNTAHNEVQQALRAMLATVIRFLESINDYMRFKDEELALSISAHRVEGYEVEGINEEIDRHVREVSRFDLTCPVSGVGPGVIRKLLLEENLKIRGRKDSKMEVVALLFSDVFLMTKVQKKGERLKVIRPPLALDRTHCFTLRDGCSFVLVEVGELLSVMNVYIFVTGTTHSCSTWVSTVLQAKETLRELRDNERSSQLEKWRLMQEAKTLEVNDEETETEQPLETPTEDSTFVGAITEEPVKPEPVNGLLSLQEADEPQDTSVFNSEVPFWQSPHLPPSTPHQRRLARRSLPAQQPVAPGYELIEMEVRSPQPRTSVGLEEEQSLSSVETQRLKKVQSVPDLEHHFIFNNTVQNHNTRPHSLLLGGHSDIDYPVNEHRTFQQNGPEVLNPSGLNSRRRASDSVSVPGTVSNSSHSLPVRTKPSELGSFHKDIRSPGLRRRRPQSTQSPSSKYPLQRVAHSSSVSNHSSSNSDSESSVPTKRNSVPSDKNSVRVLTLNSLKPNLGMFWSMKDDPQTLSESELPDLTLHNKRAKLKAQRSASIPNIVLQERSHQSRTASVSARPPPSPLQGLLIRAKERDRDSLRVTDTPIRMRPKVPPSPSVSTMPSPSPSDVDRDPSPSDAERESEWEEEVELLRHRVLSVSQGWREQLVDGDEDDIRSSVIFSDGENVDWPGWCFDDEEVMDHLQLGCEGLLEGINKTLGFLDLQELSEQEEGECSQV